MSGLLLAIVGVIYLGLAITYYVEGNMGMCITFSAYAVANAGLYIAGGN